MNILSRLLLTNKKFKLINKNDRILVAISGGPDSVALISLLLKIKKKYNLYIALSFVNYNTRGIEAKKDEELVTKLAKAHNLNIYKKKFLKYKGPSFQDWAREKRFEFFENICNKNNFNKIALGHNKDDNVETFFINLLRGSAITGLKSIPPSRKINARIEVIHPLIEIERKEIIDYLNKENLRYRIDRTNLENNYLRNRIRNQLIPFIETKFSINLKDIINREIGILNYFNDFYLKELNRCKDRVVVFKDNKYILPLKKIRAVPEIIMFGIYNEIYKAISGETLSFEHIKNIDSLLNSNPGTYINLPENIIVYKNYDSIQLYREKKEKIKNRRLELPLNKFYFDKYSGYKIKIGYFKCTKVILKKINLNNDEYFDLGLIELPLFIRRFKKGDYIYIDKEGNKKKLSDIFIDKKIDKRLRRLIPVIVDKKDKILLIPGIRRSYTGYINSDTERILSIKIRKVS